MITTVSIVLCLAFANIGLAFPQDRNGEVYTTQQQPQYHHQQQQQLQNQQQNQHPQFQGNDGSTPIPIISQTEVVGADGSFNHSYETGNGIRVEEGGYVKKVAGLSSRSGELSADGSDNDGYVQVFQGSYSYTAPDGQVISLRYIADENGFQPEGDHLPTTPAIPQDILRSLDANRANPDDQQQQYQQQQYQQQQYQQQQRNNQPQQTSFDRNPPAAATFPNFGDTTQPN